ncbi:MAG: hypothetical protein IJ400_06755 [Clostridia bacterium]|nr:hypothetical protein [Clostridia bacterium]
MAIYKLIRKDKRNNLKFTLSWSNNEFSILIREKIGKRIISSRVKGVASDVRYAITIFEQVTRNCTNAQVINDLIIEIEAKHNMLIL